VFGLFQIVDHFAGFILHFIPFYYVLKMFVLIAMFHPSVNGATWVYKNYLKETFEQLEKQTSDLTKNIRSAPKTE
jgi:uncharacterized membrane protein required for colicin V production